MKNSKRILSVLLAAIMLLSTISVGIFAFAEETEAPLNTINYVAIGNDVAAGINTDIDGEKSYAELVKESYKAKGYNVNYNNFSQTYYGSNEIRKHLAIDDYKVPDKFKQANDFVEWSGASAVGMGWNSNDAKAAIKDADVITVNMGTNDFAYYTLFRVLDKMKFQVPNYPSGLTSVCGFVGIKTNLFGIPNDPMELDHSKGLVKEADKNAQVQMILETVKELKAFKGKADLEAALLKLQFVAPGSIQTEAEYKTAKMEVAAVEKMISTVTAIFPFNTLSGHDNLNKQKGAIAAYENLKDQAEKKEKAEEALANLSYTEKDSVDSVDKKHAAERELESVNKKLETVKDFMDKKDLEGYERIALQEKEIKNFEVLQLEIENKAFNKETEKLTFQTVASINNIEDLAKAENQIEAIRAAIEKYEKLDHNKALNNKKIASQEKAIVDWKEANKGALEKEKALETANEAVKYIYYKDKTPGLYYVKSYSKISYKYGDKDYYFKWAVKQYVAAKAAVDAYVNLGGAKEDIKDVNNLDLQRAVIINTRKNPKMVKNLELKDFGSYEGEPTDDPAPTPAPANLSKSAVSLFAFGEETEAKIEEAAKDEEEEKKKEDEAKKLAADKKAAERAIKGLTYTVNGSVRSENILKKAEEQYEKAREAIEKLEKDEDKMSLEGYENFKKQGAVIVHYKNGEWHKNAEKIQNENLAYSYKKTAMIANTLGLSKELGYMFASASQDVAKNYIKNYKAILKSIKALNPNAQVVVIGLHNPLKNAETGDVSFIIGKAVDAVNGAIFDKTKANFDISTVFTDGIGSLFKQGVAIIKDKVMVKINGFKLKVQTAVNNVKAQISETIAVIRGQITGKPVNKKKEKAPVIKNPEVQVKTEKELREEMEEAYETAANEACAALTFAEVGSIKSNSDLGKAKAQFVAASAALEKVTESRRTSVKGSENISVQKIEMDRFKYKAMDDKELGKVLTPAISKVNTYLEDLGAEAGIANFHYIDASDIDTPEFKLGDLLNVGVGVKSAKDPVKYLGSKETRNTVEGMFGEKSTGSIPFKGNVSGVDMILYKHNTRSPLFPTAKGHDQLYSKVMTALGEKPYTSKDRSLGRKVKFKITGTLFQNILNKRFA